MIEKNIFSAQSQKQTHQKATQQIDNKCRQGKMRRIKFQHTNGSQITQYTTQSTSKSNQQNIFNHNLFLLKQKFLLISHSHGFQAGTISFFLKRFVTGKSHSPFFKCKDSKIILLKKTINISKLCVLAKSYFADLRFIRLKDNMND